MSRREDGKSFSQTNAYACNRRQPSLEQLIEIAKILGVDVKELIDNKREKNRDDLNNLINTRKLQNKKNNLFKL